jgi:hypothetical protein
VKVEYLANQVTVLEDSSSIGSCHRSTWARVLISGLDFWNPAAGKQMNTVVVVVVV